MNLSCFRLNGALPDAYMSSYFSLLMGFFIDFLYLVLLFDFCNVDFIVDGPNGAEKRKDRQKQRKKEMVRDIKRDTQRRQRRKMGSGERKRAK